MQNLENFPSYRAQQNSAREWIIGLIQWILQFCVFQKVENLWWNFVSAAVVYNSCTYTCKENKVIGINFEQFLSTEWLDSTAQGIFSVVIYIFSSTLLVGDKQFSWHLNVCCFKKPTSTFLVEPQDMFSITL